MSFVRDERGRGLHGDHPHRDGAAGASGAGAGPGLLHVGLSVGSVVGNGRPVAAPEAAANPGLARSSPLGLPRGFPRPVRDHRAAVGGDPVGAASDHRAAARDDLPRGSVGRDPVPACGSAGCGAGDAAAAVVPGAVPGGRAAGLPTNALDPPRRLVPRHLRPQGRAAQGTENLFVEPRSPLPRELLGLQQLRRMRRGLPR